MSLDEETSEFTSKSLFDHPYPTTKIMWIPDAVCTLKNNLMKINDQVKFHTDFCKLIQIISSIFNALSIIDEHLLLNMERLAKRKLRQPKQGNLLGNLPNIERPANITTHINKLRRVYDLRVMEVVLSLQKGNYPDLLATSGDYLRVWRVSDNESRLECLLNNVSLCYYKTIMIFFIKKYF